MWWGLDESGRSTVRIRSILLAVGLAAGTSLAASAAVAATEGWATGNVNMRSCGSTSCHVITTIPQGARVWVYNCGSWCELEYRGMRGYSSASYISVGGGVAPRQPIIQPGPLPPSVYWYFGRPWWDDRHRSYYDGHRWWYNNRWNDRPRGGVFFEFGF